MQARNNLAVIRRRRGFAVATLAAQIGVKRQTIYAIEAGSYIPNTLVALRLAQVLEVSVEELFSIEEEHHALPSCERVDFLVASQGETLRAGQSVCLGRVGRHVVAVPASPIPTGLPEADGLVLKIDRLNRGIVQPLDAEASRANTLVVAGCDPGMSVLARQLRRFSDAQLIVAGCSSSQALRWLKEKRVHVAGTHLRDESTGESNLPAVRKLFPRGGYRVITFANWEEGLVVARGNPKRVRRIEDLSRKGVLFVNRERGAGSRFLLDSWLQKQGIAASSVQGYERIAYGHMQAAWYVFSGEVDCCIAVRAAAQAFGLGFLPLVEERYDLIVPEAHLDLQAVQIMLDVMNRTSLKRELEALGGYDTSQTGHMLV
ncbi:MAG TPA: substrate-binding domain-containing protein [Terriglobia bacterium]|nr:substrate-binding domain-containing protein [Terriglobia bacterium]